MNFKNQTTAYGLFGVLFGFCFPIIAITFDIGFHENWNFSLATIAKIHTENPLHFIIDTAPLFLGIAFGVAGISQNRVLRLNKVLKKQAVDLDNINKQLEKSIQESKDAQAQLVHAEKMAAIGQLTAGIAHEINNPVNFISSNIKPLKRDVEELLEIMNMYNSIDHPDVAKIEAHKKQVDFDYTLQEINEMMAGLMEGANRTATIVRSLKNFSRNDEEAVQNTDLNEGIATTLLLLKNKTKGRITVETNLPKLPSIVCNASQLNQVWMNLISNAIDAIKAQGTIKVLSAVVGDFICVTIADSGMGMPPEIASKIFEPFFTTKEVGVGTGLGLSISFGIIQNHGGRIEVESQPGNGTTFKVWLPIKN